MTPFDAIDEATAELLVAAKTAASDHDLADVAGFLADLRSAALGPPASVGEPLARIFEAGLPEAPGGGRVGRGRQHRRRRVVASAGFAFVFAASGVTGAAAANLLPGPVTRAVTSVVESLTPFEISGRGKSSRDAPPREPTPGTRLGGSPAGSPEDPGTKDRRPAASTPGAPATATTATPTTTPATAPAPWPVPTVPPGTGAPSPTIPPAGPPGVTGPSTTLPDAALPTLPSLPAATVPATAPPPTVPAPGLSPRPPSDGR